MRLCVRHQHSQFWPNQTCFVEYYSLFLGPKEISIVVEPQGVLTSWSSTLLVWADSGDPERFQRLMNPGVRLCVGHEHSQFWPILTRYVDYYPPFWGPEVIYIVVEPQGALTCWSTTLALFG